MLERVRYDYVLIELSKHYRILNSSIYIFFRIEIKIAINTTNTFNYEIIHNLPRSVFNELYNKNFNFNHLLTKNKDRHTPNGRTTVVGEKLRR